jgi:hypothetical protein
VGIEACVPWLWDAGLLAAHAPARSATSPAGTWFRGDPGRRVGRNRKNGQELCYMRACAAFARYSFRTRRDKLLKSVAAFAALVFEDGHPCDLSPNISNAAAIFNRTGANWRLPIDNLRLAIDALRPACRQGRPRAYVVRPKVFGRRDALRPKAFRRQADCRLDLFWIFDFGFWSDGS